MASMALTSSCSLGFSPIRSRSSVPRLTSSSFRSASPRLRILKFGASVTRFIPVLPSLSPNGQSSVVTVKAAATSGAAASPPAKPWHGAAMKPTIASIATSVVLWFVPVPAGVSQKAWQLLAIFLARIVGIITQPLPLRAVALMGLGAFVLTKTLTFSAAFSAFGDPISWLIALAFFFAKGFIKTGLGNRIAY